MKIAFVWHWYKRTTPELAGCFAAEDTLIKAIGRLTREGEQAVVFALAREPYATGLIYCERQGIWYNLLPNRELLLTEVKRLQPDLVFLNHHPLEYDDVLQSVAKLPARKAIYYSAPITSHPIVKTFDAFFVHHSYQADILVGFGIEAQKIHVAPKTADLDCFQATQKIKQWDCIYPARGKFGYWKRIELAVEACRLIEKSIVLPGATISGTLNQTPNLTQRKLARWIPPWLWRRVSKKISSLQEFPWVTTLGWQSPSEMNKRYNQARCLVITSNDAEMGPRVIPEAAACNLPIVCCSDSRACVSHAETLGGFIAEPEPKDIAHKIKLALGSKPETRQRLLEAEMDSWLTYRKLRQLFVAWEQ